MEIMEDDVFWSAFKKGDTRAFRQLYDRYIDDLFAYGRKYTSDSGLVQDAIHDLFLDLYRYRENLSRPACLRAYLLAALRRKIGRKFKGQPEHMSLEEAGQSPAFSITINPENRYIDSEERRKESHTLNQAIAALSSRQKEAIYLKYHADLSYNEIASVMGVSVATCRTLVYRAVKALRQSLDKNKEVAFASLVSGYPMVCLLLYLGYLPL